MTAHIHAELMALYAQDALETDKPWMLWEYEDEGNFYTCALNPAWNENKYYRRKPKTIRIGEYDVPEPLREIPDDYSIISDKLYLVSLNYNEPIECFWKHPTSRYSLLKQGICHSTKEAAQTHLDALLSFTKQDP